MSDQPDPIRENATVEHQPDRHRYAILVDGTTAGFTVYVDRGEQRVFVHTEIDDQFGGHGLSSILIRAALDDVRAAGLRIVGVCPLVAAYLKKHDDYRDITDPVTPQILEGLR